MHMLKNDIALLHRLADTAAEAILPHFRQLPSIENKAAEGFDPVTIADKAAETAMRRVLEEAAPDDAILGEEQDDRAGTTGRTWIIDPIDGTRGFMTGLPTWGVLVAIAEADGPHTGMMSQPFVGDRFFASPEGAFHADASGRTRPIATRECPTIDQAILASTSPRDFDPASRARFETLADACRMVRFGTDCYAYAMLAAGHIDVVVERGLKPFDIAPFVPIIERAGGSLTDWSGNRIGPTLPSAYGGEAVAVGDKRLLEPILAILNG
ncbi:inositol monophosphatase family protein [Acuticoccus sp. M5D2P5]|uniref:inositol monophosphatase family protein n=1 Tax=Acuticoccus kalidii TaxID=2910977 RepID=UPI001F3C35B8|nr:inositol monophosphatase family protein [Acuticoccus kalidii]MCF3936138.1 inositol monophosphatase family protein [Acuticoccus kalidii]